MKESSATIKLSKSEIEWVIISLVHAKNSCEHFSNFDNTHMLKTLIDDFIRIKESIIQGEKKIETRNKTEEEDRSGPKTCESCID
tara:strand:+ start:250 stop:504 length:255 start_codon:yes stop_codon:yes gene_type:complete